MNQQETRLRDAKLGAATDDIRASLPPGWRIVVELEKDSQDVTLFNPDGCVAIFTGNAENLADTLREAYQHAEDNDAMLSW